MVGNEVLEWLLEPGDPGVRYLALRDLVHAKGEELAGARKLAHAEGPIAAILSRMDPEGYWEKPGAGYLPKYTSTVWSLVTLAQLGASVNEDPRIEIACAYAMEHSLTDKGSFSVDGRPGTTADCLQGNMLSSLLDLGFDDPRLDEAFDWMARSQTGEGVAPVGTKDAPLRYYAGKVGPDFACGANNKLSCAWGAVKVMTAFSRLPEARRTPLTDRAVERGIDFLLGTDPAGAGYPCGYAEKPSGNWWKFGFPVYYVTDILQIAEALVALGYGKDPRLSDALGLIRSKQDDRGCWALEYDYTGKTWVDFGPKKQPNKWVTLRALRVLNAVD